MSYDMKGFVKSLNKLTNTEKNAASRVVTKAATKQRPALLSFDEVEAAIVPDKRSIQITLSGPKLEEDMINDSSIEIALDAEVQEIVGEMMQNLRDDLRRLLG